MSITWNAAITIHVLCFRCKIILSLKLWEVGQELKGQTNSWVNDQRLHRRIESRPIYVHNSPNFKKDIWEKDKRKWVLLNITLLKIYLKIKMYLLLLLTNFNANKSDKTTPGVQIRKYSSWIYCNNIHNLFSIESYFCSAHGLAYPHLQVETWNRILRAYINHNISAKII